MLRSHMVFIICLVLTAMPQDGIESLLPSPTQQERNSSQSTDSVSSEEARVKAEVAEIMAIREQIGGGVAETLGDLSLEMPHSSTDKAAARLDATETLTPAESFAQQIAQQSRSHVRSTKPDRRWTLHDTNSEQPSRPNPEHREMIRHAARMLEEAAALLEEAQQYNQADAVRENAGQLWRSAR